MIVVGAGIAGLVFARDRAIAGDDVVVVDAAEVPGGVLASRTLGDLTIDAGAESFALTRPEALDLVRELGLESAVVSPVRANAQLALPDRLAPLPAGMLGIPLDLDDEKVVAIIGREAAQAAAALDLPDNEVPITVGAIVRSRMGDAVADHLVDPVLSGVHATRADRAEADTVLPRLRPLLATGLTLREAAAAMRGSLGSAGSPVASLHGGMATLAAALHADLLERGVDVRLGSAVSSVQRTPNGRWLVVTADGLMKDERVCVAVPGAAAASILSEVPEIAGPLGSVQGSDVAVAALLVRNEQLDGAPVGSGVLVSPHRTDVQAKAMTHASAKWQWIADAAGPGRHVLRLSYGRAGEPVSMADDAIIAAAIADAATLTGCRITPADVEDAWVQWWRGSLVDPLPGHSDLMRRAREAPGSQRGLAVVGSCLGGNGIAGIVADTRGCARE